MCVCACSSYARRHRDVLLGLQSASPSTSSSSPEASSSSGSPPAWESRTSALDRIRELLKMEGMHLPHYNPIWMCIIFRICLFVTLFTHCYTCPSLPRCLAFVPIRFVNKLGWIHLAWLVNGWVNKADWLTSHADGEFPSALPHCVCLHTDYGLNLVVWGARGCQ